ncbi:MAG: nucleotidyltransferase domain-containing protein [Candidatus Aenigmatarchaeota archaeon]
MINNTMTKTEINILKLMASRLTERFSILEIAKELKQNYSIVYASIQTLYKRNFLIKEKHKKYLLNYKTNTTDLAYIESLRSKEFLEKHTAISSFVNDVMKKSEPFYFTFLIFGSYVSRKQTKQSDIDILIIVPDLKDIDKTEVLFESIAKIFSTKFHINVMSIDSVSEMLAKRNENNVFNETLNNHIICFGAENYYKMLLVR